MNAPTVIACEDGRSPSPVTKAAVDPIWRVVGILYVGMALGLGLIALFITAQGAVTRYYVPHACACLECRHPTTTGPEGTYCSVYPPREIRCAGVGAGYVAFCRIAVRGFGIVGLLACAGSLAAGLLWLIGRPPGRWANLLAAGPLIALVCLFLGLCLMFPYGAPLPK